MLSRITNLNFRPIKTNFEVDPAKLNKDLRLLEKYFQKYSRERQPIDDGTVEIIPLLNSGGHKNYWDSEPNGQKILPTVFLKKSKYFKALLDKIPGEIISARLVRLSPGSRIRPHRDNFRNLQSGILRLHIPIETDPKVKMYFGRRGLFWDIGEAWLADYGEKHSVVNFSSSNRTHLVIDFEPNMKFFVSQFGRSKKAKLEYPKRFCNSIKISNRDLAFDKIKFRVPEFYLNNGKFAEPLTLSIRKRAYLIDSNGRKLSLRKISKRTFRLEHGGPNRLLRINKNSVSILLIGAVTQRRGIASVAFTIPFHR